MLFFFGIRRLPFDIEAVIDALKRRIAQQEDPKMKENSFVVICKDFDGFSCTRAHMVIEICASNDDRRIVICYGAIQIPFPRIVLFEGDNDADICRVVDIEIEATRGIIVKGDNRAAIENKKLI